MAWLDALPQPRREFINEFGLVEYRRWKASRRPMSDYITDLLAQRRRGIITNAP